MKTTQRIAVLLQVAEKLAVEDAARAEINKDCEYLKTDYDSSARVHKFYAEQFKKILEEAGEDE